VLIRKRLGWLTLLFVGGLATSRVISQFGDLLAAIRDPELFHSAGDFIGGQLGVAVGIADDPQSGDQGESIRRTGSASCGARLLVGVAMGCVLGLILASLLVAIALFRTTGLRRASGR
jgi:hypothetical protein